MTQSQSHTVKCTLSGGEKARKTGVETHARQEQPQELGLRLAGNFFRP